MGERERLNSKQAALFGLIHAAYRRGWMEEAHHLHLIRERIVEKIVQIDCRKEN